MKKKVKRAKEEEQKTKQKKKKLEKQKAKERKIVSITKERKNYKKVN